MSKTTTNDKRHFHTLLEKAESKEVVQRKVEPRGSDGDALPLSGINFDNFKKFKKPRKQTIHFTLSQRTIDLLEEASQKMGDGNRSGTLEKILLDVFENKGRGLFGV